MHTPKGVQLGMKRVMRKGRSLRSKRAVQHLVWTSATHARDRDQADKLRAVTVVELEEPRVKRAPLDRPEQLAAQVLFVSEDDIQDVPSSISGFAPPARKQGQLVSPDVFEKVLERERKKGRFITPKNTKEKGSRKASSIRTVRYHHGGGSS
jgi:hypothetical protein